MPTSRVFCAAFVGGQSYPCLVGSQNGVEFAWPSGCGGVRRRCGLFDRQKSPRVPILCVVRAQAALTDVIQSRFEASTGSSKISIDSDIIALTGTASGSLYLWSGIKVEDHIPHAHDGPVYAVAVAKV